MPEFNYDSLRLSDYRISCVYCVSTDKQVDFNSNHEADLPMQRKACHKFAESKGWVIRP